MPGAPLVVPALTSSIADDVLTVARSLPYRSDKAMDSDRVFWIDVAGRERIGVAWSPNEPDGPWLMLAISRTDGKSAPTSRVREVVEAFAGRGAAFEKAPLWEGAPTMQMVRFRLQ